MMFWFSDVHKIHWKTPAIKVFLCKVTCCFTGVLWNSYFLKNPAMESFLSSQTWCFTKYVTLSQAFSSKLKNFFRAIFFRTPQERDFAKSTFYLAKHCMKFYKISWIYWNLKTVLKNNISRNEILNFQK